MWHPNIKMLLLEKGLILNIAIYMICIKFRMLLVFSEATSTLRQMILKIKIMFSK